MKLRGPHLCLPMPGCGPSLIPPASLCKRSPSWSEGAGATLSREKDKGSKVGVPWPPSSQEDKLLCSGPSSAPGIQDPVYLLRQTGILGQGAQRQRRKETFSEKYEMRWGINEVETQEGGSRWLERRLCCRGERRWGRQRQGRRPGWARLGQEERPRVLWDKGLEVRKPGHPWEAVWGLVYCVST